MQYKVLATASLITLLVVLPPVEAQQAPPVDIKLTRQTPIFDGKCKETEWQHATQIDLPAKTTVYLMHDDHSLFICAKSKAEDYTVIDIYIEDTDTGYLHNLHASAQLGERINSEQQWQEISFWDLQDWGGFWVPFSGTENTENGANPTFLKGSHREIQILRKKFPGDTWNMMINVGGIHHKGKYGASFSFPSGAMDNDRTTWTQFRF